MCHFDGLFGRVPCLPEKDRHRSVVQVIVGITTKS